MKRGTFIFSLLIVCLLVVSGCVPVNLSGFATSTDKSKEDKFKDIIYISEEAKISKEQQDTGATFDDDDNDENILTTNDDECAIM